MITQKQFFEFVENFDLPPNTDDPFSSGPGFRSRSRSIRGEGNPYLHDDLSNASAQHTTLFEEKPLKNLAGE